MITPYDASTAMSVQVKPEDISVWEHYKRNTDKYGNIAFFSHMGTVHYRDELKLDVEALAAFFEGEFEMRSDRSGIENQKTAAVIMPTNAEGVITFYALNKIGAVTFFMHPLLPNEKIKSLMRAAKVKCLVTTDTMAPRYFDIIKELKLKTLICSQEEYSLPDKTKCTDKTGILEKLKNENVVFAYYPDVMKRYAGKTVPSIEKDGGHIGLLLNGGGTTGKSRTIILSNLAINGLIYGDAYPTPPTQKPGVDTEVASMPFFHMYGFAVGALSAMNKVRKIVFMPIFDSDEFIKHLKSNHVNEFSGVPNMYKKLLQNPSFPGEHLKSIRVMFAGGDYVTDELYDKMYSVLRESSSDARFCQGYGLTECCAVCTVNPIFAIKRGTIGRPLPGTDIRIWDEDKNELPFGETGEIAISGITVMDGYLNEDGTVDPGVYIDSDGTKWVLTGDLGKMDEDGYITFMGRKKRLVVISGYNVYPMDIELAALDTGLLDECCAAGGFDGDGKPIVRLYAVLKDGKKPENESHYSEIIRENISRRLSKFNIPREIKYVKKLPRTKLDKIDFMSLTQFSKGEKPWEEP